MTRSANTAKSCNVVLPRKKTHHSETILGCKEAGPDDGVGVCETTKVSTIREWDDGGSKLYVSHTTCLLIVAGAFRTVVGS